MVKEYKVKYIKEVTMSFIVYAKSENQALEVAETVCDDEDGVIDEGKWVLDSIEHTESYEGDLE